MRHGWKIACLAAAVAAVAGCESGVPKAHTAHNMPPPYRVGPDGLRIDNAGYRLDAQGYRIDARGRRIGLVAPTRDDPSDAVSGYWVAEHAGR